MSGAALAQWRPVFQLLIGSLCDFGEPLAISRSTQREADLAFDPMHGCKPVDDAVAKCCLRQCQFRGVKREALSAGTFVHEQRGGTSWTGQQSAAQQLQSERRQIGR